MLSHFIYPFHLTKSAKVPFRLKFFFYLTAFDNIPSDLLARHGYIMGDLCRDSIVLAEWNLAHLLEELGTPETVPRS